MTNPLEPNDLSHLSDEEFMALCPQGFHGTGDFEPRSPSAAHWRHCPMTDHFVEVPKKVLSPAAEAVLRAAGDSEPGIYATIAAALRALADQVRLELPLGDTDADEGVFAAHHAIYSAILTIATELEGTNGPA